MAHSYGPSKKWGRCAPKRVEIMSDRSWETPSGPVDLVIQFDPSLDQQVLRLSRKEAANLQEALRRVLADEGRLSSWSPYVIGQESETSIPSDQPV